MSRLDAITGTWKLFLCCFLFLAFSTQAGAAPQFDAREPEYQLGAGDVIWVTVWKERDLSQTVVIRPDGNISLPLIGEVHAEGKTPGELDRVVAAKLRRYLVQPIVSVIVKEVNSPKITIVGKVRKPDTYIIRSPTTVLEAIAMAGGLREDAGSRLVILRNGRHGLRQKIVLDLKRLLSNPESGEILVRPFDTLYVP